MFNTDSSPVKAWSFSRYSDYKQCPLKFKLKHIDRIKEPSNAAMERGSEIHDKAEAYIKGKIKRIPKELKEFEDEFKKLKNLFDKRVVSAAVTGSADNSIVVEDTWAFTKDWEETQWDNWVQCWVRIKLDCAHVVDGKTLVISDWKTGKYRPQNNDQYIEQLELYALAALLLYPDMDEVVPRLVYLDAGVIFPTENDDPMVFTQDDLPNLQKIWSHRTKAMFNDRQFAPRPNRFCMWCHYRANNKENGGGQCEY